MILSQGRRFLNRRTITTVAKLGTQFPRSISSSSSLSSPLFNFDNNHQQCTQQSYLSSTRYCSSSSDKKSELKSKSTPPHDTAEAKNNETSPPSGKDEGESLKDTVRRMQQEKGGSSSDNFDDPRINDFVRQASDVWSNVTEEVGKTWGELLRSGERKDINKQIRHPEDTVAGEQEYSGPVAIMLIDESENLTAWERMQKRLTDAPLIQGKYEYEYQYQYI
jgi:hypothetical protein